MKIWLNKSQIIFPEPEKRFEYYTFWVRLDEDPIEFILLGRNDSEGWNNDFVGSFPISLNSETSRAKWSLDGNNVISITDDYGCLSLKVQLNTITLLELVELFRDIDFCELDLFR